MQRNAKNKKLDKLKVSIWVIAALWFVSDVMLIVQNGFTNSSTYPTWLYMLAVFMPSAVFMMIAWWIPRLLCRVMFADFFPTLVNRILQYATLFISVMAVGFFTYLQFFKFVSHEPHTDSFPYPTAFSFLLFSGLFYFALLGRNRVQTGASNW